MAWKSGPTGWLKRSALCKPCMLSLLLLGLSRRIRTAQAALYVASNRILLYEGAICCNIEGGFSFAFFKRAANWLMLVIVFCSTVDGVDGGACSDLSYTKWVGLMQFDIFGVSR